MNDQEPSPDTPGPQPEIVPEVVDSELPEGDGIDSPAKLLRIGTMLKRLLSEVRSMELDEPSRERLKEIYAMSVDEISETLSPDLREELTRLAAPFEQQEAPSAAELQVAKAQLVGWLEGLISGMQAMLFAQESVARRRLEAMRAELLPGQIPEHGDLEDPADAGDRPGTYL